MKKILIITGETSGELHAVKVIKELKRLIPDLKISGIGSEKLKAEGVNILYDSKEIAVMGFWEVLPKFFKIKKALKCVYKNLLEEKPDLCLLVDFPGFNLKVAKFAHRQRIKVVYYILPQVWAWGRWRIKTIENYVDKGIVALPFETEIYTKLKVNFFGHPLVDELQDYLVSYVETPSLYSSNKANKIALLPGSRKGEIRYMLPIMLECVKQLPGYDFLLPVAPGIDKIWIQSMIKGYDIELTDNAYETLKTVCFAIVKSGTATLETSIIGAPMVIIYKTSLLSYIVSRLVVRTKWIGLPNLIAGKQIVPEFIQYNTRPEKIIKSINSLLENRIAASKNLKEINSVLGTPGVSKRVADFINQELKS